jgi:predicted metalloprotease with PDZ domain
MSSTLAAQTFATDPCIAGRSSAATIGVGSYTCYGGNCILFQSAPDGRAHVFTVEPMLRGVPANGPAGGKLRDGDIIIAVDGALITTADAGRRLASPVAGRPIHFRVRRRDAQIEVDVTPVTGCEVPGISIADNAEAEARGSALARRLGERLAAARSGRIRAAAPDEIPIDFGMTLDCTDCGWRVPLKGGALSWHSSEPPRVATIDPGGPAALAGLRVGDTLIEMDGAHFTGDDGSRVWNDLRPGRLVKLHVRRGDSMIGVGITPRRPSRIRM